jgi:hypothetical protein
MKESAIEPFAAPHGRNVETLQTTQVPEAPKK